MSVSFVFAADLCDKCQRDRGLVAFDNQGGSVFLCEPCGVQLGLLSTKREDAKTWPDFDVLRELTNDEVVGILGLAGVPRTSATEEATVPTHWERLLCVFAWFCGKSSRECVHLALADLRRDAREMHDEGRSERFIAYVTWWRTITTIVGIVWAFARRVLEDIAGVFRHLIRSG